MFDLLRQAIVDERPVALATVIQGPNTGAKVLIEAAGPVHGTLGNATLDEQVQQEALVLLDAETSTTRTYATTQGEHDVLIEA